MQRAPDLMRLNNRQRFHKSAGLCKRMVDKEFYRTLVRCRLGTRYSRNYQVRDRQKPMWIGSRHQNNNSPMFRDNGFHPKAYAARGIVGRRNEALSKTMSAIHVVYSHGVGCYNAVDWNGHLNGYLNLQCRARRGR